MQEYFRNNHPFKVLVVDDNYSNLEVMAGIFEISRPHYILYKSNNPESAISIAQSLIPDLVITDWDMPKMNGLQVIEALKANKETSDIPVIMVTGINLSSDDLQLALNTGAIDFVRKPIDPIELIARSQSALIRAEYHKSMMEIKNQELTENSLSLIKNNQFKNDILLQLNELHELIASQSEESGKVVSGLIYAISNQLHEDGWYKFNLSFDKVHGDFRKNVIAKHPDLTGMELKLCALIRLGMNNKDLASLLNQNIDSIKVSRSRLRKKLGLTTDQNLEGYLNGF